MFFFFVLFFWSLLLSSPAKCLFIVEIIVETILAMSPGRRRLRCIFRRPAFHELSGVSLLSASHDNYDFDAAARTNEERVCEKGG
jgi:hypothetical protein